jgi:hypothetical protein
MRLIRFVQIALLVGSFCIFSSARAKAQPLLWCDEIPECPDMNARFECVWCTNGQPDLGDPACDNSSSPAACPGAGILEYGDYCPEGTWCNVCQCEDPRPAGHFGGASAASGQPGSVR